MRPEREACSSRWRAWTAAARRRSAPRSPNTCKSGAGALRRRANREATRWPKRSAICCSTRRTKPCATRRKPIFMRPVVRRMCARWCVRRWNAATRWSAIGLSIPPWPIRARGGSWAWNRLPRSTRWPSAKPGRISPCICACPPTWRFPEGSARPSRTGWNSRKPTFSAARIRRMNGSLRGRKSAC